MPAVLFRAVLFRSFVQFNSVQFSSVLLHRFSRAARPCFAAAVVLLNRVLSSNSSNSSSSNSSNSNSSSAAAASSEAWPPPGSAAMLHQQQQLLLDVLEEGNLSKAGDLFAIADWDIVTVLPGALPKLKQLIANPTYLADDSEQSVVEITIARITSAIRETNSIETYAPHLVDLLQYLLGFSFTKSKKTGGDAPHAKIAADLLSCLFLHYSMKSVMMLTIPVAVQILSKDCDDLIRSTSSYLSLAAIHNEHTVGRYASSIIRSVKRGNFYLIRILNQIYQVNKEPFHANLNGLMELFDKCEQAEKVTLLQLCASIASTKPEILVPHFSKFKSCLSEFSTCFAVLGIYANLIEQNMTEHLGDHVNALSKAGEFIPSSQMPVLAKVIAKIGIAHKLFAQDIANYLIVLCYKVEANFLKPMLNELDTYSASYPATVRPYVQELTQLTKDKAPNVRALTHRIRANCWIDSASAAGTSWNAIETRTIEKPCPPKTEISQPVKEFQSGCGNERLNQNATPGLPVRNSSRIFVNANELPSLLPPPPTGMSKVSSPNRYSSGRCGLYSSTEISQSQMTRVQQLERIRQELPTPTHVDDFDFENRDNSNLHHPDRLTDKAKRLHDITEPLLEVNRSKKRTEVQGKYDWRSCKLKYTGAQSVPMSRKLRISKMTSRLLFCSSSASNKREGFFSSKTAALPLVSSMGTKYCHNVHSAIPFNRYSPAVSERQSIPANVEIPKNLTHFGQEMVDACTQSTSIFQTIIANQNEHAPNEPVNNFKNDAIRQFCEKHMPKIENYIIDVRAKFPVPCLCTVEERGRNQSVRVHFSCQERGIHCLYSSTFFVFKTKHPSLWLHVMFLHLQVQSSTTLSQSQEAVKKLKACWECLSSAMSKSKTFTALVTSAFPTFKDQQIFSNELQNARYFDKFAYNEAKKKWCCFACNQPERVQNFLTQTNAPVIEGQLKEKRGRWKFLKRWRTKYFTLSSASLSYQGNSNEPENWPAIELRSIRSVKSVRNNKRRRSIPNAFEIFTDDNCSYMLKAKDGKNAEEWFQCLQIGVAQAHRD
ncbi:Protein melted -like protein [Trichinella nativa]|uniref:Protein melted-like protein n=1 Tax=Trichinella nativa TaxID=6335 RepID=A0A0V1LI39_9BILA|nr:Protein melted -like protein [Trichinella nativa]